jgi:hypothetical protein
MFFGLEIKQYFSYEMVLHIFLAQFRLYLLTSFFLSLAKCFGIFIGFPKNPHAAGCKSWSKAV